MFIRPEVTADAASITGVIERAFANHPFSSQTEHFIVNALRSAGALTVSLVAEKRSKVVGHVAISPISISDGTLRWYGLGPVAVEAALQGQGIGSALVREALIQLRSLGAAGCVVLGEPAYYRRFAFQSSGSLVYPGPPPEHFMSQAFAGTAPRGEVAYHEAFASEA